MIELPSQLAALQTLAYNLHWTWNYDAVALFTRLDPAQWEATNHNPIRTIAAVGPERLQELAQDQGYCADLASALAKLNRYLDEPATWYTQTGGRATQPKIAYFSMEFGLHECLPIYSGGLGVLAGDHLKSASDLGLPLTAVGLFYHQGYFNQVLDDSGWQKDNSENNDPALLPMTLVTDENGAPVTVTVTLNQHEVQVQAWRIAVGRITLYLLDTDLPANSDEDRQLTARLYGGDSSTRIQQEIVLGIGGCRLLQRLQIQPDAYHMNEGHAAFLILERARDVMQQQQLNFYDACAVIRPRLVFTTHTPVAAGHDYFSPELMERFFSRYLPELGISLYDLLALGRHNPNDEYEYFCMTILALHIAAHANGVSRLHGEVSREQWRGVWPDRDSSEIPIGHITNGVHLSSFLSEEMALLYQQ